MITFGLTGGIASGKSTVTKTFRSHGIPVVDADIVARQVVEPGTAGLRLVIDEFGTEYLQGNGTLDRIALGKLVFADSGARDSINKIMLPLISAESNVQIKKFHDEGYAIVGYDAALICEMGNLENFRPLIVVHCPQDMQVARLMSRNSLTRSEAMARIEAQMPVEHKVALADYVIDTSQTIEFSREQTKKIIHRLRSPYGRYCYDCGRQYAKNDLAIMCEGCGYDNPFEGV
jgi:dephospho-CoA kinase